MKIETKAPSPGESITEVQISKWLKSTGDYVEKDEIIAEIESDKATLTIHAESAGELTIIVKEGETVPVNSTICTIETEAVRKTPELSKDIPNEKTKTETPAPEKSGSVNESVVAQKEKTKEETLPQQKTETVPVSVASQDKTESTSGSSATPLAKKIMDANRLKPEEVMHYGKGEKINKADVFSALENKNNPKSKAGSRIERREKVSMLRKKIAQRLVAVKNETAMLTTFNEVDMSVVMNMRKQYKEAFTKKFGIGLGFMSFFTKAVTVALQEFPSVCAILDKDEVIHFDYADIGIAVSAPKGLMVPVIRNAESKSLAEIEHAIAELASKAREGKITLEEMSGGNFTITNGGVFGSLLSTPIINPPQSAILGMHNIVERPVAINGKVEIRPMMYVALSYDHRVIDGKESVGFLLKVKQMIEDPVRILHSGKDPALRILDL